MRVFIGIKAPEELQKLVLGWQEANKRLPVRFIARDNLHITLVPPWYEKNIDKLIKTLTKFKAPGEFEIFFENINLAPPKSPRLIWAAGSSHRELGKLRSDLSTHLKRPQEARPFQTHITIARFRPETYSKIKGEKIGKEVNWRMKFVNVTLFESILSPSGANYRPILSLP